MMGSSERREWITRASALRGRFAGIGLVVLMGSVFCAQSHAAGEKELLAPTGHLRVGVYAGSPTSLVTDPNTKQIHGVTYDLGKEFASRLNVSVEYIQFQRIADVIDAMKDGKVDFTVTNATPVRAKDVGFSQILLAIELGYLVPANSFITGTDQIDGPGIRIGVTKGGTSERVLSAKFKNAKFLPAESVAAAINSLRNGELDVYATNKAILFEMLSALPGARILEGNWGQEHMAIAVPKGRGAGQELLDSFVRDVQSSGLLEQIEASAGLKGTVKAAAKD
jgi:polar amino acid transport system substrate-binding protein